MPVLIRSGVPKDKSLVRPLCNLGLTLVLVGASVTSAWSAPLVTVAGPVPTTFVKSSDGTLIAVSEQGPRDAPAILFVPGYLQGGAVFYNQIASPDFLPLHIITMDLRGQGYSGKPQDVAAYENFGLLADDIHAVITQLRLDRPVLAAWSLGSIIAINYIEKYGQGTLRGLDLIDPIVAPNAASAAILAAPSPFVAAASSSDVLTAEAGGNAFVTAESDSKLTPQQVDIFDATVAQATQASRIGLGALPLDISYGNVLASITIPVLIQAGSPDPVAIPGALPVQQQLLRTSQTKLYPGGEHVPFALFADQFNHDLAEWLIKTVY